jgi:hypothetical protein
MQQDANKMIKQLNNEALQTATGGCAGCGHIASAALRKGNKAVNKFLKAQTGGGPIDAALSHSQKGVKLTGLAQRATQSVITPPKQDCLHCKNFKGFVKELASQA